MKKRRKYAILEKIYRKKNFCAKRGKKHEKGIVCGLLHPQRGFPLKELAEYFIQKLEETGAYEIERLCLMDENLSYFSDGFFFSEKPFWRRENSTIRVSAMRTGLRRRIKL